MTIITKELAERIVVKLEAEVKRRDGAHDIAKVVVDGKIVAIFGLRRGSKKDSGHDHIPSALYVSPHNARLLAQCPLSREDWVGLLRAKRLV